MTIHRVRLRLMSFALVTALGAVACGSDRPPPSDYDDDSSGGGGGENGGARGPAFPMSREAVSLLPFDVRLAKLAKTLGVEVSDPVLEPVREKRLELGDHDYANGVPPDRTWSSGRVGVWVRALRSVCTSDAMRAQHPKLPEGLDAFVLAAFGRRATDEDRSAVNEAVAGLSDPAAKYQTTCLAVFSSLEFVAR